MEPRIIAGVEVAGTFRQRWRGLRPTANGRRLLIRGSSVHGFGMKEPLWAVGLDHENVATAVRRLAPWRIVWIRGVRWILEMPIGESPPSVGDRIRIGDL